VTDYEPEALEARESSYYELALTNRQVFAVIVLFLASLSGAFLAGVWFARDAMPATVASAGPAAASPGTPPAKASGAGLDEYRFFSEQQSEKRTGAATTPPASTPAVPQQQQPLDASRAGTTLAQDVGARPTANDDRSAGSGTSAGDDAIAAAPETRPAVTAAAPVAAPASAPSAVVPPSAPTSKPAAEPAATAATSTAPKPAAGDLWVQVFSSADAAQARRVVEQLRQAGYRGAVSAAPGGSGPALQRVRIGPYRDREQAQRVADDVRRKLKFSTWITSTQ
jgi:cell division septation protein DedD